MTVKELLVGHELQLAPIGVESCRLCALLDTYCVVDSGCCACKAVVNHLNPELVDSQILERAYLVRKESRSFVGYVAVDGLGAFLYPKYPPVLSPIKKFWRPAPEAAGSGHSNVIVVPKDFLGDKMPEAGEAPVRVTVTVKVE